MKRSFLAALGLEKEVVDQIMQEHGATVETLKERAKESETALREQLAAVREELKNAPAPDSEDWKKRFEEEAAAHQKSKEELSGWKKKHADEAAAHQAAKDAYAAEKADADTDAKVAELLREANMNDLAIPKALKLYDRSLVERGKDGGIANKEKVLASFRSEWGGFFKETTLQGADIGTPPPGEKPGAPQPRSLSEALHQKYERK